MTVLGLDPGTRKCGYALIAAGSAAPVALGITAPADLGPLITSLATAHPIDIVALGGGTNSTAVADLVAGLGLRHVLVDERETTLRARVLFFADHPPSGWKRFVPRGLLLPDRPIDDYAAVLIAERYLAAM